MSHADHSAWYQRLVERINRFPQGAPPSELLFKILKVLFSEQDAHLISLTPIRPFTIKKIAGIWKMREKEARVTLNTMADRGLLVDIENDGGLQKRLAIPA